VHPLAAQVAGEIAARGLSAVYEPELSRVWPKDGRKRERQVEAFAKEHGWRLGITRTDLSRYSTSSPANVSTVAVVTLIV